MQKLLKWFLCAVMVFCWRNFVMYKNATALLCKIAGVLFVSSGLFNKLMYYVVPISMLCLLFKISNLISTREIITVILSPYLWLNEVTWKSMLTDLQYLLVDTWWQQRLHKTFLFLVHPSFNKNLVIAVWHMSHELLLVQVYQNCRKEFLQTHSSHGS